MFHSIKKRICQAGFSLTEMSISMSIVGLIAASALSVAITSDYATKKDETEAKMARIEESLAGFLATNYRLPCPADATLAITNANFGSEGTRNDTTCPRANAIFTSGNLRGGAVPVTTLQLPDDFALDGWGRRITYIVDYRFANNLTTNASCTASGAVCFIDTSAGGITVRDASGTARTSAAVYLLLSHGENGHGAFPKNGGATRINAFPAGSPYRADSPAEMENAELDNAGSDTAADAIFVQKEYVREDDTTDANREYFDDIVHFMTKSQLVKAAGATLYDSICRNALAVINSPASNDCSTAADSSQCQVFATDVNTRCLQ